MTPTFTRVWQADSVTEHRTTSLKWLNHTVASLNCCQPSPVWENNLLPDLRYVYHLLSFMPVLNSNHLVLKDGVKTLQAFMQYWDHAKALREEVENDSVTKTPNVSSIFVKLTELYTFLCC